MCHWKSVEKATDLKRPNDNLTNHSYLQYSAEDDTNCLVGRPIVLQGSYNNARCRTARRLHLCACVRYVCVPPQRHRPLYRQQRERRRSPRVAHDTTVNANDNENVRPGRPELDLFNANSTNNQSINITTINNNVNNFDNFDDNFNDLERANERGDRIDDQWKLVRRDARNSIADRLDRQPLCDWGHCCWCRRCVSRWSADRRLYRAQPTKPQEGAAKRAHG
jgi:hypothetical protein